MSNPTGSAISWSKLRAQMPEDTQMRMDAKLAPDAREARLLALVKDWQEWEKIERNRGCGNFAEIYRMCAVELEAALGGNS